MSDRPDAVECPECGQRFDPGAAGGFCTNPDCGEYRWDPGSDDGDGAGSDDGDGTGSDDADGTGSGDADRADGDGRDGGNIVGDPPEVPDLEGDLDVDVDVDLDIGSRVLDDDPGGSVGSGDSDGAGTGDAGAEAPEDDADGTGRDCPNCGTDLPAATAGAPGHCPICGTDLGDGGDPDGAGSGPPDGSGGDVGDDAGASAGGDDLVAGGPEYRYDFDVGGDDGPGTDAGGGPAAGGGPGGGSDDDATPRCPDCGADLSTVPESMRSVCPSCQADLSDDGGATAGRNGSPGGAGGPSVGSAGGTTDDGEGEATAGDETENDDGEGETTVGDEGKTTVGDEGETTVGGFEFDHSPVPGGTDDDPSGRDAGGDGSGEDEVDCPNCESTVPDSDFCLVCGHRLSGDDAGTESDAGGETGGESGRTGGTTGADDASGPDGAPPGTGGPTCPTCREPVESNWTACPFCGTDLSEGADGGAADDDGAGPDDPRSGATGAGTEAAEAGAGAGGDADRVVVEVCDARIEAGDGDTVGRRVRSAYIRAGGDEREAEFVHREHVRFERGPDGFYLVNRGTNGTRLNGENLSLDERRRVTDGDEVEFSGVTTGTIRLE